jgi:hypothetical protein
MKPLSKYRSPVRYFSVLALFCIFLQPSLKAEESSPYQGYWLYSGGLAKPPTAPTFDAGKYGVYSVFFTIDQKGEVKIAESEMLGDFPNTLAKKLENSLRGATFHLDESLKNGLTTYVAELRSDPNPQRGTYLARIPADEATDAQKKTGVQKGDSYLCDRGACFVLNEKRDVLTLRSSANPDETIATYRRISKDQMNQVVSNFVDYLAKMIVHSAKAKAEAELAELAELLEKVLPVVLNEIQQKLEGEAGKNFSRVMNALQEVEKIQFRAERLRNKLDKKAVEATEKLLESFNGITKQAQVAELGELAEKMEKVLEVAKELSKELDRVEAELK